MDAGEIERPSSDRVAVSIDRRLQRGTYTVTWRVVRTLAARAWLCVVPDLG